MTNDFRALCAELLDEVAARPLILDRELIARARAALAESVAEGPSLEEVEDLCEEHCFNVEGYESIECLQGLINDALARWGSSQGFLDSSAAPPPAEGEVAELVARLRRASDGASAMGWEQDSWIIARAADLLSQRHPVPVPVSERLPGPEDCDAEGRCWFLRFPFDYSRESWSLEDRTYGCNTGFTHWLPATALPLPQGEVRP